LEEIMIKLRINPPRRQVHVAYCVLPLLGLLAIHPAHADTVLLGQSGLITGSESFVFPVMAPSAGTLNVQLTDIAWPDRLSSLSGALTTATSVLHTMATAGDMSVAIGAAGTYYVHIVGVAQDVLDMGLYSLRVDFQGEGSPVPLPGGAWLLLAGMAGLAAVWRKSYLALGNGRERTAAR
jgi:hypothetical protein